MPATTAPAAITTCRPICEPGSTIAPWPSQLPSPIDTGSFFHICMPIGRSTILVAVVLVGDVHVVAGPDVVADLDALVADDADALAERAAVADRDDRIAAQVGLRRHARADARERSDRACPRRSRCDPRRRSPSAGTRSCCRRRTCANARRAAMARTDRAEPRDAVPRGVDRVARDAPDVLAQHRDKDTAMAERRTGAFRSASGCSTTSRRGATCSPTRCGSGSTRSRRRAASIASRVRRATVARPARRAARHEVVRAFDELDDEGVVAIVGPSISDNALIVGAAVRRGAHPRDQLLGRRAHAFAVDVPLPGRLARRGAAGARGAHGRARACAAPR